MNDALPPRTALARLQALAEPTRLAVVRLLATGEKCVCDLQVDLGGAAQSRLSFHLKKLRDEGIVRDRKQGRWVHYSLVPGALTGLGAFLRDLEDAAHASARQAGNADAA